MNREITDQYEVRCFKCRRDRHCSEYHRLPDVEVFHARPE